MVRAKVLENPYGSGPGLYRSSPKPSEKSHERTSQTPEHQVTHCHVDEGSLPTVQQSHVSGARRALRVS
jgi:hypothetical protein